MQNLLLSFCFLLITAVFATASAQDCVPTLQAKVTANEVSGNGMLEGWWHRDALSRNRTSAFGMQLVPDDDSVSGLIPTGVLSNSLDRSRQFSEIISFKYESDAEFAEVIATELEKRQREVNYASAALGVGAIVNTAGRIAITEGGGATIGYLTKVAGGYAIFYAGAAATEFGIDQAQKNGLVTANQATATRMGIALFQIVVAKRQTRAEARASIVTPNPQTGVGYGVNDPPVRIHGAWTEADFKLALQGRPPSGLGSPDLHHADQMPGSAIHEVLPGVHRGNPALHPNGQNNQGVTSVMRMQDRQLHWWYRAREQGADKLYPNLIYKKR